MSQTSHRPDPLPLGPQNGAYGTETTIFQVPTVGYGRDTKALHSRGVSFATNKESEAAVEGSGASTDLMSVRLRSRWTPVSFKPVFWVPYTFLTVATAIGLEVGLYISNRNDGYPVLGAATAQTGVMHYVYTAFPSAIVAVIFSLWAGTDNQLKKMQPYIDLVHGDAPS